MTSAHSKALRPSTKHSAGGIDGDARSLANASRQPRVPRASRPLKERGILQHAEVQFAQFGFEGASLENIAAAAGISRHNLLYYFPSKEALYQRVLDDVLNEWLGGMQDLSQSTDPEAALRQYIRAKLRYSREHPHGAKVFTKEMITGLQRYSAAIAQRVTPVLKADVRTFERWAREGKIARIDFTHLLFVIWSVTQPTRKHSSHCCWASPR